ncbi:MAG: hypothetical protein PVSMB6_04530 [Steroidobacteraceae bacterium]
MSAPSERGKETAARHERAIGTLLDRTDAPVAEVRGLYAQEFSRLELGAKVRSYLAVLTASNVRTLLRRKEAHHVDGEIRRAVSEPADQ